MANPTRPATLLAHVLPSMRTLVAVLFAYLFGGVLAVLIFTDAPCPDRHPNTPRGEIVLQHQ